MACMNNVVPSVCPEIPDIQKEALHKAVRCANLSINVLFRNWNAFKAAGVSSVTSPYTFYGSMGLSAPRHFGGVKPSTSPSDPIIVSFGTGGTSGMLTNPVRSEERRVGNEGASTCSSRWTQLHSKKKK